MSVDFDTLVVGGGHAGVQAVQSLRAGGFAGTIGLISAEPNLPYERPPLSKAYLRRETVEAALRLRAPEYYADADVELMLGERVDDVDPDARTVTTANGRTIGYRHLLWAAGGSPRELPIPGAELDGVCSLRTIADADDLADRMRRTTHAIIIGGGHIGLEVAAALRSKDIAVTVVEAQPRLLARVTSPVVSQFYLDLHRANGVEILLNSGVSEIVGTVAGVEGVRTSSGRLLPAQIVLVGVGLVPSSDVLARAGVRCTNGIDTDHDGRTNVDGIFAIGDCANRESPYAAGDRVRIESVPNATEHAKVVAAAILGRERPATVAPWFWSHQYDVKLQTAGLFTGYDDCVVRGDPAQGAFSVAYLKQGRLIAIDCVNTARDFAPGRRLVDRGVSVDAARLADASAPLKELLIAQPVA